jgi:CheY-like chemotaxis protein
MDPRAGTPDVTSADGQAGLEGDETILVVDDAEVLRPLLTEVLESYGYRVLLAASGPEALVVAERATGRIDLLLTDMVMPGMNGRELAGHLTERLPALKVLFTSGYPAGASLRAGLDGDGVGFVQKPYLAAELAGAIRALLG